jgi:hypothetical protein
MSENAKQLWETIKGDVKAEMSRLGTQGAMELASALFNGSGFVPYGPGQYTPTPEHSPEAHGMAVESQSHELAIERER